MRSGFSRYTRAEPGRVPHDFRRTAVRTVAAARRRRQLVHLTVADYSHQVVEDSGKRGGGPLKHPTLHGSQVLTLRLRVLHERLGLLGVVQPTPREASERRGPTVGAPTADRWLKKETRAGRTPLDSQGHRGGTVEAAPGDDRRDGRSTGDIFAPPEELERSQPGWSGERPRLAAPSRRSHSGPVS